MLIDRGRVGVSEGVRWNQECDSNSQAEGRCLGSFVSIHVTKSIASTETCPHSSSAYVPLPGKVTGQFKIICCILASVGALKGG